MEENTKTAAVPSPSIPEGYKKTKVGVIPEDWKLSKLAELAKIQTGIQKGAKTEGILVSLPYIRVANVQDGYLKLSEIKEIQVARNKVERFSLKKGDVLMTEGGDFDKLGRGTIWNNEINPCLHQNHVFAVRTNQEKLLPYFLNCFSSGFEGRKYFQLCSKQSTNLASINSSQLKNLPIPLPPLPEQQKIADILSTWDRAIEKQQAHISQLRQRNKGLAQQLLTGKKRLPGFTGEWETSVLADFFTERKETGYTELPLLSVGESGVYPQNESNKKDTSNADKAKYKRICPGDIGYNTMRMWQGRSALSTLEGIVSPAYTIAVPKENADAHFFAYLFKLREIIYRFFRNSQGLVSDTLNCKFKDFKIVKISAPPTLAEQTAIAQVLDKAEEELKAQEQQLEALQEQKKGLMQKLLTGQVRVKID